MLVFIAKTQTHTIGLPHLVMSLYISPRPNLKERTPHLPLRDQERSCSLPIHLVLTRLILKLNNQKSTPVPTDVSKSLSIPATPIHGCSLTLGLHVNPLPFDSFKRLTKCSHSSPFQWQITQSPIDSPYTSHTTSKVCTKAQATSSSPRKFQSYYCWIWGPTCQLQARLLDQEGCRPSTRDSQRTKPHTTCSHPTCA